MQFNRKVKFFLFIVFLLSSGLSASDLKISIKNIKISNKKSTLYIGVFDNKKDYKIKKSKLSKKLEIKKNSKKIQTVIINGLEIGKKYVISIYQDINGNKELDKSFIGMPKEPFGFSNNVIPKMGPPDYKEMEFLFEKKQKEITIELLD